MKKPDFTEPQARHIETALKLVDKAVQRVEFLFDHGVYHRGPAGVVSTLDPETGEKLRAILRRLQAKVHELHDRYGFRARPLDLERVLDAEFSALWEMLEDTRPRGMGGYGPMDPETARQLETDITGLIELVQTARRVLLSSAPHSKRH